MLSVAFSPDGTQLASGSTDSRVRLWDVTLRTDIAAEEIPLPNEAQVSHYPNPAYPEATIVYSLPRTGHVRLSVVDVLGRELNLLVNHVQPVGTHEVNLATSRLSSGHYFLVLQVEADRVTRPVTVIR